MNTDEFSEYARFEDDGNPMFEKFSSHTSDDCFSDSTAEEIVSELGIYVEDAINSLLEGPFSDEFIERFTNEIAPNMDLSESCRKQLESLPLECPGGSAWKKAYAQKALGAFSQESYLRIGYFDKNDCVGREAELSKAHDFLTKPNSRLLFITGEPGIGKTSIASAIANATVTRANTFSSISASNICFFDCEGLSADSEIMALVTATLFDKPLHNVPEHISKQIEIITGRLSEHAVRHGERILWVFDGLDEYWEMNSHVPTGSFLEQLIVACSAVTDAFRVIITVRKLGESNPYEDFLFKALKNRIGNIIVSLLPRVQLHDIEEWPASAKKGNAHLLRHPLARRLLQALYDQALFKVPEQLALFPEHVEVSLYEAASIAWNTLSAEERRSSEMISFAAGFAWKALSDEEKHILAICAELPGGIWVVGNGPSDSKDYVDWQRLFEDAHWQRRLERLTKMEWVTKRAARIHSNEESQIYRLRPALIEIVRQKCHCDSPTNVAWLIYFWSARLKYWGRHIVGRVTDRIAPDLKTINQSIVLRAEESARYLMDVTRVNWLHAFRCIPRGRNAEYHLPTYHIYLRSSICYFRMSGSLRAFQLLIEKVCGECKDFSFPESRDSAWRKSAYAIYRGSCFGMKGRTHRRLGEWPKAEESLVKAEEILYRASGTSTGLRRELAWAFTEHGRLNHLTGKWINADAKFRKAVNLRRELVAETVCYVANRSEVGGSRAGGGWKRLDNERRFLASSLNSYGNLLTDRFQWCEAEKMQREALEIRKELAHRTSCYFERYVAHCLNDLGNSLYYQDRIFEALDFYEKALEIREILVPNAESALGQYVARTCNNIGNCYRKLGRWEEARTSLERAVKIYRIGAADVAAKFNHLLARTLSNLGRVYFHQRSVREAIKALEEADVLHGAVSLDVATPFKWIETANFLALAYTEIGATNHALHSVRKAEHLVLKGKETCPITSEWMHAYTLNTKGRVLGHGESREDWEEAALVLRESEQVRLSLTKEIKAPHLLDLHFAQNWHDLGSVLHKLGRDDEAKGYLDDALQVRQRLAVHNPGYTKRLVGRTMLALADTQSSLRHTSAALGLYRGAREIFEEISKTNPNGFRVELSHADKQLKLLNRSEAVGLNAIV